MKKLSTIIRKCQECPFFDPLDLGFGKCRKMVFVLMGAAPQISTYTLPFDCPLEDSEDQ